MVRCEGSKNHLTDAEKVVLKRVVDANPDFSKVADQVWEETGNKAGIPTVPFRFTRVQLERVSSDMY